ncbi:MAG: hypothetical protein AB7F31_00410 [Parachlamydiales bacterium]
MKSFYTPEVLIDDFDVALRNFRVEKGKSIYEISPNLVQQWFERKRLNKAEWYDEEGQVKEEALLMILIDQNFLVVNPAL